MELLRCNLKTEFSMHIESHRNISSLLQNCLVFVNQDGEKFDFTSGQNSAMREVHLISGQLAIVQFRPAALAA